MEQLLGLLAVTRDKMRTRHLAYRTEQAYLQWIRRYVAFHHRRHPRDLGPAGVEQFLTHLAVDRKVSASASRRLLVVLSRSEVRAVLARLDGTHWLVANLLYGSGLRLMEALRLNPLEVAWNC